MIRKVGMSFILILFFLPYFAKAQTTPPKKNTVMDFEAEVIDGQKKAPELFLQLDSEKSDINTILYDRKDFNDFAPINTARPLFSDAKKRGEPGKK
jgi:hypothetical protein